MEAARGRDNLVSQLPSSRYPDQPPLPCCSAAGRMCRQYALPGDPIREYCSKVVTIPWQVCLERWKHCRPSLDAGPSRLAPAGVPSPQGCRERQPRVRPHHALTACAAPPWPQFNVNNGQTVQLQVTDTLILKWDGEGACLAEARSEHSVMHFGHPTASCAIFPAGCRRRRPCASLEPLRLRQK